MQREVVFLGGARTAFGTFGGTLREQTATDLGVVAARGALERSGVKPEDIDHVIFGNVIQSCEDAAYLARHIGLRAGLPTDVPAVTVNRLCASGFQSIVDGAMQILLGESDFVLAGGTESMSQAPHIIRGARWGIPFRQGKLEDSLWQGLTDSYVGMPMAITAENLAEKYNISRQEADEYAYRSQMATKAAQEAGKFREEIVPLEIQGRKGQVIRFEVDEHPRPDTTLEKLAKLPPYFKENGVVTAGNASGISDGAAAVVIAAREKAEEKGLKPLGRLLAWGVTGCDPTIMGIGPVGATKIALQKAGMTLEQIDLIEVNEAFAAQYLAVEKALGLKREIVNVNGGAIALGHPVGTSGTRLTLTLLLELRRRNKRYGLATACIGGGQGMALIIEALP
ncbi:MAG: acetyl-CoA C-acetyltransferase [Nitrospinota bacterium]|nr:MAG: acetyl-CoA C-acetyltransferase [Nitrospinota bacterium]